MKENPTDLPANICLFKVVTETIETIEKDVKYVQS